MRIYKEEIFGPVLSVVRAHDYNEALALPSEHDYGNGVAIFTRDGGVARRFQFDVQAGMVGINRGVVSDPAAPFGGVKQSGLGREGGHDGLLEYTETKYIAVEW